QGADRIERLFRILANNISVQAKTVDQATNQLERAFRRITGGSYLGTLRFVSNLFPQKEIERSTRAAKSYAQALEAVNRSYQSVLGQNTDIAGLSQTLIEGGFLRGKKVDKKNSREALGQAASGFFNASNFEEGYNNLRKGVSDAIQKAVIDGFTKAFFVQ